MLRDTNIVQTIQEQFFGVDALQECASHAQGIEQHSGCVIKGQAMPFDLLTIHVPGDIRGKGRPRFGNERTYTDSKTLNAEAWVRHCAVQAVGSPCLEGPLSLVMNVTVGIPASWSKRKQADALAGLVRPTGRPDCDNQLKLASDALNGIVWKDDAQLVDVTIVKRYGREPGAVLEIGTL